MALLGESGAAGVIRSAVAAAGAPDEDQRACADAMLEDWDAAGVRPEPGGSVSASNVLRLLARAAGDRAPWSERLADTASHLLALRDLLAGSEQPEQLIASLAGGDLQTVVAVARRGTGPRRLVSLAALLHLIRGDSAWTARAADTVMGRIVHAGLAEAVSFITPFGGLFFQLPLLEPEALLRSAECGTTPGEAAMMLAMMLLMQCAGRERAPALFEDEVWRRITGIDPRWKPPAWADPQTDWARSAAAVVERFASRLRGFERSSPERLYQNFLDVPARVTFTRAGIEARVARPPLAIVLQMAGYDNFAATLPWLNDLKVSMTLEEE
jgi:hypothetical protein